jgi:DNA-binding MarR family transcriptional regulator
MSDADEVDLSQPDQLKLAFRVGLAWIAMRRGAGASALREFLFGVGDDALEQGQMDTLDLLAQHQKWRMSDLADALRVDPSTATRAVHRLVNAGLADRRPCDEDGRVVIVRITRAGRSRHSDVAERRGEVMRHILGEYTPAERPILADMLERFVASIDDFVETHTPAPTNAP